MAASVTLDQLLADAKAQLRGRRVARGRMGQRAHPRAVAVADRKVEFAQALVAHLESASGARMEQRP